jgi:hypothetical protein
LAREDRAAVETPPRYLGKVVMRLCLDRMKSARAWREVYVGQWLPEPVVNESLDSDIASELVHDLSSAGGDQRQSIGCSRRALTHCRVAGDLGPAGTF